jgi:hypothetical protein
MLFIGLGIFHQTRSFFADFLYISSILHVGNYIEGETFTWDQERSSEAGMRGDGQWAEVGSVGRGGHTAPLFACY